MVKCLAGIGRCVADVCVGNLVRVSGSEAPCVDLFILA